MRLNRSVIRIPLLLLVLLVVACPNVLMNDIQAKIAADTAKDINSFVLTAAANAKVYLDIPGVIDEKAHTISLTVPKWIPLTGLVATFQFQGASVTVNGSAQTSGVTANDFSQPVKYTVTPASGAPVDYTVTATTGPQGLMGGVIQGTPLSLSGTVTTSAGQASPFGNPAGVVYVSPYLYIADSQFSVIWRVSASSGATSLFAGMLGEPGFADQATGPATAAQFDGPTGLATDGTYLYVTDSANNRIRKIDIINGYVTTLAGTGAFGHADGLPGTSTMNTPTGICYDGASTLYETDRGSKIVRSITLTAGAAYGTVTTLTPLGTTPFAAPVGIAYYGGNTNLYVADEGNHEIYQVTLAAVVTNYSGNAGNPGWAEGLGTSANFNTPIGLTVNSTHLYVADSGNHVIREVDLSTGNASTYLGVGTQSGYVDASGGTNMMFNTPNDLCVVGSGTSAIMYITESGNLTIRDVKLATTPFSSTLAGVGPGSANGTGSAVRFNVPRFIATNGSTMWISDQVNDVIRSIDLASGMVSTVAGQLGVAAEHDGTGAGAQFNYPGGLTTDGKFLYICDSYGQTIRKMDLATGQVTTIAGGSSGFADGVGSAARFQRPAGITTDGTNLYVADYLNNAIRKIDPATLQVTTIAGSLAGTPGDADGTGTAATFNNPIGITTDGTNLYVAENLNHKVRQIVIGTWVVTTLAGPAPGSQTAGYVNGAAHTAEFRPLTGITTDGTSLYVPDFNQVIRKVDIASGTVSTLVGAAPPLVAPAEIDGVGAAARFNKIHGIATDGKSLFVVDVGSNTIRRVQ